MFCLKSTSQFCRSVVLVTIATFASKGALARRTDPAAPCGFSSTKVSSQGPDILSKALESADELCTEDVPASTPGVESAFLGDIQQCAVNKMEKISPGISSDEISKTKADLKELRILLAISQAELHVKEVSSESLPSQASMEVLIPPGIRQRFAKLPKMDDLTSQEISAAVKGMSIDTEPLTKRIRKLIDIQTPQILKNGANPMPAISSVVGWEKDKAEQAIHANAVAQIDKMLADNPRLLFATENNPTEQGISRAQNLYASAVGSEAKTVRNLVLSPPEPAALGLLSYSPCVVESLKKNPNSCAAYSSLTVKWQQNQKVRDQMAIASGTGAGAVCAVGAVITGGIVGVGCFLVSAVDVGIKFRNSRKSSQESKILYGGVLLGHGDIEETIKRRERANIYLVNALGGTVMTVVQPTVIAGKALKGVAKSAKGVSQQEAALTSKVVTAGTTAEKKAPVDSLLIDNEPPDLASLNKGSGVRPGKNPVTRRTLQSTPDTPDELAPFMSANESLDARGPQFRIKLGHAQTQLPTVFENGNGAALFHGSRSGSLTAFLSNRKLGGLRPTAQMMKAGVKPTTGELGGERAAAEGIRQTNLFAVKVTDMSVALRYAQPRFDHIPDPEVMKGLSKLEQRLISDPFPVLFGIKPKNPASVGAFNGDSAVENTLANGADFDEITSIFVPTNKVGLVRSILRKAGLIDQINVAPIEPITSVIDPL